MNEKNREETFDPALLEALVAGLRPAPPADAQRAGMRARILGRVRGAAPAGTITQRAAGAEWIALGDLIRVRVLREDRAAGNRTLLIHMRAGAEIPGHAHEQEEECFVLEGEIEVGAHVLAAGDMHVALPGAAHERLRCRKDALLLVRSEIPPHGMAFA
ncbi:MAG: cupin domain-containing protein [Steroidobacteraceae bacterium]